MVTHISIHHRRGLFNFLVGVNVSKARPRRKTLLFAVFAIQTRVRARRAAAELNEASTRAPTSKPDVSSGNTRIVFSCHHMLSASWDEMTKNQPTKQIFFSLLSSSLALARMTQQRSVLLVHGQRCALAAAASHTCLRLMRCLMHLWCTGGSLVRAGRLIT